MKTTIARKTAYIGAGAGLVLFALFGLMPGSLLRAAPWASMSRMALRASSPARIRIEGHRTHPCSSECW